MVISRLVFDQTAGHHSLANLTLKWIVIVCKSKEQENEFNGLKGCKLKLTQSRK